MKTSDLLMRPTDIDSRDHYSYSEPDQVRVKHLDLELDVQFDQQVLKGTVLLTLDRRVAGELILDTRSLVIYSVEYSADARDFCTAQFELGAHNPTLGAPLRILLPAASVAVRISYSTAPEASGLQWLEAPQTAGKQYPYLYTQSEATHARSWIPLQDTPRVRSTYSARVKKPANMRALMSAYNNPAAFRNPDLLFSMPYPVPSYLLALAVGDLDWRGLGPRTGVFSEKPVVERAARELDDLEKMLHATEELFGPYRWNRFDALVLPPSFPVGGMENPCLTFITPTIIAGDKSLTSLIVHEMAHSWSSNLVSSATWRHIWLNEGITVYMERRIVESLYGRRRAEMEAVLGLQDLEALLKRSQPEDQLLVRPDDRDPNAGFSDVPYQKGALFFRTLEASFGRPDFDAFLRRYLDHFAFQSVTTAQFVEYLESNLLSQKSNLARNISIDDWLHLPGIPSGAARPTSDVLAIVEERAGRWLKGELTLHALGSHGWTTQEWLRFLTVVSSRIGAKEMAELDSAFRLTQSGNSEVENQWFLMAIRNGYRPAFQRLEEFLATVGRRKFLRSLYGELCKTPEGKQWALAIYKKAHGSYHPITRSAIEEILKPKLAPAQSQL